jgi:hypothetical protein
MSLVARADHAEATIKIFFSITSPYLAFEYYWEIVIDNDLTMKLYRSRIAANNVNSINKIQLRAICIWLGVARESSKDTYMKLQKRNKMQATFGHWCAIKGINILLPLLILTTHRDRVKEHSIREFNVKNRSRRRRNSNQKWHEEANHWALDVKEL